MKDTTERLAYLRKLMRERELSAFIVPTADAHQVLVSIVIG